MNENQIKIIADSLIEASKMGTVNALTYIQKGLEAYKALELGIVGEDGSCSGTIKPYMEDKGVQTFVDVMLVYLDEAIKSIEKGKNDKE